MELTATLLKEIFAGNLVPSNKPEGVKMYDRLKVHADGEFPKTLIEERRPSESDVIKTYRQTIYAEVTKETISKIINALNVIRRSSDWSIKYNEESVNSKITEDETLESYCEKNFPFKFTSLTNWVFSELLKQYLIDANGFITILPINPTVENNEYLKPFPKIINIIDVMAHKPDEYFVFKEQPVKRQGTSENGSIYYDADVFIVVTNNEFIRYEKNQNGDYIALPTYAHNLGYLPIINIKGVFKKRINNIPLYESRIQSVAPRLDEVAREYSDLQAEVVQHIHSTMWQLATQLCIACADEKGKPTGFIKKAGKSVVCPACQASGKVATSPYTNIVVRNEAKAGLGEKDITGAPAGFIQKQTEIVKIQDERINKHVYLALASLNMQFLDQTPLNVSGLSKEVDRDALNTFVNSIAEDIVWMMEQMYQLICDYRYRLIVPNKSDREKMLPKVTVPEKFDLLSANYLLEEISKAKTSKISPVIIAAMELEYTQKKFYTDVEIRNELQAIQELDPVPAATDDEKMLRLQNKGITELDYVISCNIQAFVRRAKNENKNFYQLDYKAKKAIIVKYAEEIIKANSAKAAIENIVNPE